MPHSVGAKITELREKRHLTQAQLAEQLHFTHQTISNWERGVSSPDLETVVKLADFFQVSADELLFGKPKASSPAPQKLYRYMTSVPVGAANALKILLRVFMGLTVTEIVFSLLMISVPVFAGLFGLFFVLALAVSMAGTYIAVLVLFLFAKEFSDHMPAKIFFFLGIALYVVNFILNLAVPISSTDNGNLMVFIVSIIINLAGFSLILYSAPFTFRKSDEENYSFILKKYFSLATGTIACTLLSGLFDSLEIMSLVFNCISLFLMAYTLLMLSRCTEDKTQLTSYVSSRPPQSAWLKDGETHDRLPAVNAQAAAIASAERRRAAEIANLAAESAPIDVPTLSTYEKTITYERESLPPKALWIAFAVYAFFLYIFPLIAPLDINVVFLTFVICAPFLVCSALFALSKQSVHLVFTYILIAIALAVTVSTFFCFCYHLPKFRDPTEPYPYFVLALPVAMNCCFVFVAALCFRSTAKNKAANVALSLTAAALSVGILVLFLISSNDPNADPALLLLDFWANGAVFAFLLFFKKQKIKILTETVTRKRI